MVADKFKGTVAAEFKWVGSSAVTRGKCWTESLKKEAHNTKTGYKHEKLLDWMSCTKRLRVYERYFQQLTKTAVNQTAV